jgi:hypothetical protein
MMIMMTPFKAASTICHLTALGLATQMQMVRVVTGMMQGTPAPVPAAATKRAVSAAKPAKQRVKQAKKRPRKPAATPQMPLADDPIDTVDGPNNMPV